MLIFGRGVSLSWAEAVDLFGTSIGLVLISALLLAAISIGFVIFLGLWTYADASERTNEPALWTLIVMFVPGFVGLIIYLIAGRDKARQSTGRYKKPLIAMAICFVLCFLFLIGSLIYLIPMIVREFGTWLPVFPWYW